jgi:hypothetical protein
VVRRERPVDDYTFRLEGLRTKHSKAEIIASLK